MIVHHNRIAVPMILPARVSPSGPFMALSAAGGARPGVYAGFAGHAAYPNLYSLSFVTPVRHLECGDSSPLSSVEVNIAR
jgi:hypothetical protein